MRSRAFDLWIALTRRQRPHGLPRLRGDFAREARREPRVHPARERRVAHLTTAAGTAVARRVSRSMTTGTRNPFCLASVSQCVRPILPTSVSPATAIASRRSPRGARGVPARSRKSALATS